MHFYLAFFLLVVLSFGSQAWAECENPPADAGTIIFNSTHNVFQGCTANGKWMAFHCAASSPPQTTSCETGAPGAQCDDGAFFIGSVSGIRIYAAPTDEVGARLWKGSSTPTTGTQSMSDGFANTYDALNNDSHPAGYSCATKTPVGTWYLPSRDELHLMWANKDEITLPEIGIDVTGIFYWSSSENYPFQAFQQRFSDGVILPTGKNSGYRVRCVRR